MQGEHTHIKRIEKMLRGGEYNKALLSIEALLEKKDIAVEEMKSLYYLKGKCFECLGKFEEAISLFLDADQIGSTGDQHLILTAKIKAAIGSSKYELGEYESAIALLSIAFNLLRDSSENRKIARIQKFLGWSYLSIGKLKTAKEFLEDSISTFRRVGDFIEVAMLKNYLARIYLTKADWKNAIELYEEAIDIRRSYKKFKGIEFYLTNMGTALMYLGEFKRALLSFKKSLRLAKRFENNFTCIHSNLLIGWLFLQQHDFEQSRSRLTKGLTLATEKGMKREMAIGYEYLGELAFEQGDYDKAEEYYEKDREIAEAIAPGGDLINELYRRIADLKIRTGDLKAAWAATERALEVSRNLGDRYEESLTYRARGRIFKEEGNREEAIAHFSRCLKTLEAVGEKYERARTHLEMGVLLGEDPGREEDFHQADVHLQQAMGLFEHLDVAYYKALTALETARVHVALQDDEMVLSRLKCAEDLTHETVEEEKIDIQARGIYRALEESIIDRALSSGREENPLTAAGSSTLGYPYTPDGLEEILEDIMGHVVASRGFIARREVESGHLKVAVTRNLDVSVGDRLLGHFKAVDRRIFSMKRPLLSIDVRRDGRFDPLWSDVLYGIDSLVLVPFGVGAELEGLCYLDRESCMSRGPFLYREAERLVSMAGSLAFFVAALERDELRKGNRYLSSQLARRAGYENIVTQDPRMFEILDMVDRVKNSTIPVMLMGETGTGKELVAKAIHYSGVRRNRRHIAVNCAALPDNLLESELFGHKRGSFTGATVDKKGLLEVADRGTFFLDEIADMGLAIQVKLLRFLESGEIKRLGDTVVRQVDVRVISATNKDLAEEIRSGRFREDLFYRLNGIKIVIPPLRERRADIPLLVSHFIAMFSESEEKEVEGVTPEAMNVWVSYDWPGNVRELMNEVHRAMTLVEDGGEIGIGLISDPVKSAVRCGGKGPEAVDLGNTLPELMASFERQQIFMALRNSGWVKTRAAKDLGIHEATLRGKMRRYGLRIPGEEG